MGRKKVGVPKKFWVRKRNFGAKRILCPKIDFGSENRIWIEKILGLKKVLGPQQILCHNQIFSRLHY